MDSDKMTPDEKAAFDKSEREREAAEQAGKSIELPS